MSKIEEIAEDGDESNDDGAENLIWIDKIKSRSNCKEDTSSSMRINFSVDKVKIVFIHPQNKTYPVFTLKAN